MDTQTYTHEKMVDQVRHIIYTTLNTVLKVKVLLFAHGESALQQRTVTRNRIPYLIRIQR